MKKELKNKFVCLIVITAVLAPICFGRSNQTDDQRAARGREIMIADTVLEWAFVHTPRWWERYNEARHAGDNFSWRLNELEKEAAALGLAADQLATYNHTQQQLNDAREEQRRLASDILTAYNEAQKKIIFQGERTKPDEWKGGGATSGGSQNGTRPAASAIRPALQLCFPCQTEDTMGICNNRNCRNYGRRHSDSKNAPATPPQNNSGTPAGQSNRKSQWEPPKYNGPFSYPYSDPRKY
jgi:hypothetical protein